MNFLLTIVCPAKISSSPGKAAPKSSKDDVISLFQFLFPFPEAKRERTIGSIAITLDVDHYFFFGETHSFIGSSNDSFISLMRYQPCNIFSFKVIASHDSSCYICHVFYSKFENSLSFLIYEMLSVHNRFNSSRSYRAASFLV